MCAAAAGGGGDDQPAAARRAHGLRAHRPTTCRSSCCRSASALAPAEPWASMENTGHLVRRVRRRASRRWRLGALAGAGARGGGLPAGAVARARRVVVGRRARVPAADRGAGRGADGARGAGGVPRDAGAAGDAARLRVERLAAAGGAARLDGDRRRGRPRGGGRRGCAAQGRSFEQYPTALGYALLYGGRALAERSDCARRTLDVSGDGTNNDGIVAGAGAARRGAARG